MYVNLKWLMTFFLPSKVKKFIGSWFWNIKVIFNSGFDGVLQLFLK